MNFCAKLINKPLSTKFLDLFHILQANKRLARRPVKMLRAFCIMQKEELGILNKILTPHY